MSFGQGGPYGSGGQPPTPDWGALAEQTARKDQRRRWLLIGGGVLATGAIAAIVAVAVANGDSHKSADGGASGLPAPPHLPSQSPTTPQPSFSDVNPPAPPQPLDIISSAKRDTAPLTTHGLFPDATVQTDHRGYRRGGTSATKSCASAAQGGLPAVLSGNGCREMFRATYSRGGVAVTVGIAVFDTAKAADAAKKHAKPNVTSLPGHGVPSFCRQTACRSSANAIGRYAYFTISGYTSGKPVTASDTKALQAGRDLSGYAFQQIWGRGTAQASAIATKEGATQGG